MRVTNKQDKHRLYAERTSRDFTIPIFISLIIHVFLAYLIWDVVTNRKAVKPVDPINETPLILSLATYTASSHDEMDLEVVSAVPNTDPKGQHSQSSPESDSSTKRKSETVVTLKAQDIPDSETQEEKSPANKVSSFDLDAAYRMDWGFERIPEFKEETFVTSLDQARSGSEAPEENPLEAYLTSSGLDTYFRMAQAFGELSESESQEYRIKSRIRYMTNFIDERSDPRYNCNTAYTGLGIGAIFALIHDAITGEGCKWGPVLQKGKKPLYIISSQKDDKFKTLLPVKVYNREIMLNITEEGEIWIKGKKINLNAIRNLMEVFKNEYPDGTVFITFKKDSLNKMAIKVVDEVTAAKIKMVVIAAQR